MTSVVILVSNGNMLLRLFGQSLLQELHQSDIGNTFFISPRSDVVADDNDLAETIVYAFERVEFLFALGFIIYPVSRLDIIFLLPVSSNKIYLILNLLLFAVLHLTHFHYTDIHQIPEDTQMIIHDILHDMSRFLLAEV